MNKISTWINSKKSFFKNSRSQEYYPERLHYACAIHSLPQIKYLIRNNPDITRLRSECYPYALPIHTAIKNGAPAEIIQFLIQSYPDSLRQNICESKCFMLPIHLSLSQRGPHNDVFKALIQVDPEALKVCHNIQRRSYTSLYVTCTRKNSFELDPDLIISVLKEYMNTKKYHEEQYPLHTFLTFPFFKSNSKDITSSNYCYEKIQVCFVEILKAILSAKEFHLQDIKIHVSLAQPDDMGNLPLHVALTNGHSNKVIDFILKSNPAAACKPNKNGDFPLHIAVANGYGTLIFDSLVKEFPDAIGIPNMKGNLPIFLELKKQCPNQELVSRLWDTFKAVGFKAGYFGGPKQVYSMSTVVANNISYENKNLDWLSISYLFLKEYPEFILDLNDLD